jgi:dihydrofolate reductase
VITNPLAETIAEAGGTASTLATSGVDDALRRAREGAGFSRMVIVTGGAEIMRRYFGVDAVAELHVDEVAAAAAWRSRSDEAPADGGTGEPDSGRGQ